MNGKSNTTNKIKNIPKFPNTNVQYFLCAIKTRVQSNYRNQLETRNKNDKSPNLFKSKGQDFFKILNKAVIVNIF